MDHNMEQLSQTFHHKLEESANILSQKMHRFVGQSSFKLNFVGGSHVTFIENDTRKIAALHMFSKIGD